MKGIVFDFNGTLLWDAKLHEKAWSTMAEKYIGRSLNEEEMIANMHGRTNDKILEWLLGRKPRENEIIQMSDEKERIYRDMCTALAEKFTLAPGATQLLDELVKNNFPRAIATSSAIDNLNFYLEKLHLNKWFEPSCIIYDQGLFPGKPAPDIYLHAFKAIGIEPSQCAVVEDAIPGIQSALAAGAGEVFVINEKGDFGYLRGMEGNIKPIRAFNEIKFEEEVGNER